MSLDSYRDITGYHPKNLQMSIKWKILKIPKWDNFSLGPKIYSYSIILFLIYKIDPSRQTFAFTKKGLQNNIIDFGYVISQDTIVFGPRKIDSHRILV